MTSIKVEIITIGDEILIGQIVDTNSAWMAILLNQYGFLVEQITSVHDEQMQIVEAVNHAMERVDIVLITGGIGPTNDDITKRTLVKYFETSLVFDESVLRNIEQLFSTRPNFTINELTRSQAMVPENCTIIQNLMGTAPITWFEKSGKILVSMPGVPYEMQHVMSTEVVPRLKEYFNLPSILHRTLQVYGYGESALALKITEWENSLPSFLSLAYLPNLLIVKLRLSGVLDDINVLEYSIDHKLLELEELLGDAIVSFEDTPLNVIVSSQLRKENKTISLAESCTGGFLSHQFTILPGSSDYFVGSVVAYSNEVKTNLLNVSEANLNAFGAVSKEVVEQMAQGVRSYLNTDYSLAVSGIAGPTGGTEEKSVGTVWIAVASEGVVTSRMYNFGKEREQNIQRAAQAALLLLKEII